MNSVQLTLYNIYDHPSLHISLWHKDNRNMQSHTITLTSTTNQPTTIPPPSLPLICLTFLGFIILIKHITTFLNWVFTTFLRHPKNLHNYGSWALITGATDGIGKAFAHQLANHGLNLILVSRSQAKLDKVCKEFHSQYLNLKIKTIEVNFSKDLEKGVERIKEVVDGVEVGVLINNVGITYPRAMFFDEVDESIWMEIVRVNVEGTTRVTKAVVGGMIKRKKGAIVNIGSGAAIVVPSHPLFAIYAATKAYVDQLSRSLYVEYKRCGIDVQCQVPLYVSTKMVSRVASIERPSLFTPSPEDYARAAIACIGYEPRCTPYWAHSLQWFFAGLVPEALLDGWRLSIGVRRRKLN